MLALIALSIGLFCIVVFVRDIQKAHAARRYDEDLLIVFGDVERSLLSGAGLLIALQDGASNAKESAPDIERILQSIERGGSLRESVDDWAEYNSARSVQALRSALCLSLDSGGSHVRAIEGATEMLRMSLASRELALTHATQARASAVVLTCIPLLAAGMIAATESSARKFFVDTTFGGVILVVSVLLDGVGALWMNRLIRSAT